jgi:SAM-dependent methyltransferase
MDSRLNSLVNHTHYNGRVHTATAQRLLDVNRRFYTERGRDFSATRQRLQPGVTRILGTLSGGETILDLGCGNGELARVLSRRGHRGAYLGLDFSRSLLGEAESEGFLFPVTFLECELADLKLPSHSPCLPLQVEPVPPGVPQAVDWAPDPSGNWSIITAFAVLHHMPSYGLRIAVLKQVHEGLLPDGRFIHSNWQFLHSPRLKARVQPWEVIGLEAADVDANDALLDWRSGGKGLRYVHEFDEPELAGLAGASGFEIQESFYSDGADGRSSLYQVWSKASPRR